MLEGGNLGKNLLNSIFCIFSSDICENKQNNLESTYFHQGPTCSLLLISEMIVNKNYLTNSWGRFHNGSQTKPELRLSQGLNLCCVYKGTPLIFFQVRKMSVVCGTARVQPFSMKLTPMVSTEALIQVSGVCIYTLTLLSFLRKWEFS